MASEGRVLVVDDDAGIRKTLELNLRARGYTADLASTGEEALVLAARNLPDLVIVDLGLPGIEGLDVIRGIRGWTPTPIIVLSGREKFWGSLSNWPAGSEFRSAISGFNWRRRR